MIDRDELQEMFEDYDHNVFEGKPSHYKQFVRSFLDYHFDGDLWICMENGKCDCPNPYHTAFQTRSRQEAVDWLLVSPDTRMIKKSET